MGTPNQSSASSYCGYHILYFETGSIPGSRIRRNSTNDRCNNGNASSRRYLHRGILLDNLPSSITALPLQNSKQINENGRVHRFAATWLWGTPMEGSLFLKLYKVVEDKRQIDRNG
ncbi:hypothetical protein V6N13_033260 [Hibiscus sabdariffa]|uniref:Uncharacterized protein n=1 Tax=Hibiscus sabdariffa TaxID=183260 RepID=A0ABR2FB11_9ROSI